ncbi:polyketide synthase [Aspergillus sclerotialis]|uniref:Polyketide synthase n=1 Tax=Aspergillus sclerotialis TaxID=2070753 RepID=A0A3A2ZJ51_9EURO|nr:polyketide synthase [Aspergillus sclerotialis]
MKAVGRVFRKCRSAEQPLYVGSVKGNIGHLEGASGLASLVKCILILEKGIIPPNALFEKINLTIDADFFKVKVPVESTLWPNEGLRRISVNSFGFGGSNTHVVLDDALHYMQQRGLSGNHCTALIPGVIIDAGSIPSSVAQFDHVNGNIHETGAINGTAGLNGTTSPDRLAHANGEGEESFTNGHANGLIPASRHPKKHRLFVWSAADQKALERMLQRYKESSISLRLHDPSMLDQLAFTLSSRRSQMLWRAFAVITDAGVNQEAKTLSPVKPIRSSTDTGIAFVFTGQGAQYIRMGLDLICYQTFAQTLREIDSVYARLGCAWSIFNELHYGKNIDKPEYSQPICTAIQIALVELLETFGIVPKAVVGHSSGEIAAAYAIGALSLHSACKVAFFRGKLTGSAAVAPGAMLSINVADTEVPQYLNRSGKAIETQISVACINSPFNCTLSGPQEGIDAVKAQADRDGIFAQKLKTGVAYHSVAIQSISDEYLTSIGTIEGADRQSSKLKARIPMVSSVSGKVIRPDALTKGAYWVNNLVSPVRFADAIQTLTQETSTLKVGIGSITDIVEIGPHAALKRPVIDTVQQERNRRRNTRYTHVLHRSRSSIETTLELVGQLFCLGHKISLEAVNQQSDNPRPPFLVNCPSYPFDRSNQYWTESRISRDFRLREAVHGDTLGVRVSDWNPLEPRWRNFLSIESTPWTGDHKVGLLTINTVTLVGRANPAQISDTVLYPAAGMVVMAIEAVQQMVPKDRTIQGYLVKHAEFINPILVPATWEERTETQVRLRPSKGSKENTSLFHVVIFSYARNIWTECCNATIMVEYSDSSLNTTANEAIRDMYKSATASCTLPLDSKVFYRDAAENGVQYGEMFQLLQDVFWDGKHNALVTVNVSKAKFETTSLVHPAVLDHAFQVLIISAGPQRAANIPVQLKDAWFAPSSWQHPQTSSIKWLATMHTPVRNGYSAVGGQQGSIYAISENGTVLCRVQQAILATVSKASENKDRKLLYRIEWKPQLSLLEPNQLSTLYPADTKTNEASMAVNYGKLCSILDTVAMHATRHLDRVKVPENLRRHVEWLELHIERLPLSQREEAEAMSTIDIEARLNEIDTVLPAWKVYTVCARRLPEILTGEVNPLEVIFKSDLADTFYAALFENMCADGRLASILDLAAHENPAMRILEVGAGTGGMTGPVIAAFEERDSRTGASSFAEYSYTDISPAFLERAKSLWPKLQAEGRLKFQTLDLDRPIENQGFEPSSYDIVIAASVLHATPYLETTIQNVRKALKPGGRLILLEAIKPEDVVTNFMAGLIPGWWVAREKWRPHSPVVSESVWDHCLRNNGFSGNDLIIRDYQTESCHVVSIIVSSAVDETSSHPVSKIDANNLVLVVDQKSDRQLQLTKSVGDSLNPRGDLSTSICSFSAKDIQQSLAISSDSIAVCLVEINQPLLLRLSEDDFRALRQLTQSPRLLWVTSSGPNAANTPEHSAIQGFLRSIRAEQPSSHIVSLNIEGHIDDVACADSIAKIVETSFRTSSATELEYIMRDGVFITARVIEDVAGNKTIKPLLSPQLRHEPWSKTTALRLSMGDSGTLNSPAFLRDTKQETPLDPNDIEIEAEAWSLTERDISRKEDLLGGNVGGMVTRVGRQCDQSIHVGDRVCMSVAGCMRNYPRCHKSGVVKIPGNMSIKNVISVLYPAITAYYAILDIARLGEGDTILVHLAASTVGQVAIRIAQKQKARIYATTASSQEKNILAEELGIPSEHIFECHNATFAADVLRVTEGEGVDVILNSLVGEDLLRASACCLAIGGRLIEINHKNVEANHSLPLEIFARNITFSVVESTRLRPKALSGLLQTVITLTRDGELQIPRPPPVYNVSQLEQAFEKLQEKDTMNHVVITAGPEDVIPQFVKEQPVWRFDGSASYLVAGGFGGIGRAILQWMADRGAKHLIVPSRSGAASKAAAEVIAQLTAQGVNIIAPQCDVSSETSLSAMLDECAQTVPPIKGCINAAMVLQDGIFQENMTIDKWDLTMRSKVQTSWNLHNLLPDNLDFFVLLSSLAGVVGQMASANYSAGCSFQDALARYRVSRGQRAVSIDIGWMRNIGIIAETGAYQRQREVLDDMTPIDGDELLALLAMCCNPDTPQQLPDNSQILFGLRTPADYLVQSKTPPAHFNRPILAAFSYIPDSGASSGGNPQNETLTSPGILFRQSDDSAERIQIVLRALAVKLAGAMSISTEDVEPSKPLSTYGVDSLMAVDLRNWIGKEFGATVAVFDIMGSGVPLASIADLVAAKSTIKGT